MRVLIALLAVAAVAAYAAARSTETPATPQAPPPTVGAVAATRPTPTTTALAFPAVGQEAILIVRSLGREILLPQDAATLAKAIDAGQRGDTSAQAGSILFN